MMPPKVLWSQVVAADFLIQWFYPTLTFRIFHARAERSGGVGWILTCDTTTAFQNFCEVVEIDAIGIRQKHSRKANCIAKGPGLLMQLLEFPFLSFSILFGNTYEIYVNSILMTIFLGNSSPFPQANQPPWSATNGLRRPGLPGKGSVLRCRGVKCLLSFETLYMESIWNLYGIYNV